MSLTVFNKLKRVFSQSGTSGTGFILSQTQTPSGKNSSGPTQLYCAYLVDHITNIDSGDFEVTLNEALPAGVTFSGAALSGSLMQVVLDSNGTAALGSYSIGATCTYGGFEVNFSVNFEIAA